MKQLNSMDLFKTELGDNSDISEKRFSWRFQQREMQQNPDPDEHIHFLTHFPDIQKKCRQEHGIREGMTPQGP